MESNTSALDYKNRFDNYEITQDDIPNEVKPEIAKMYNEEIEKN